MLTDFLTWFHRTVNILAQGDGMAIGLITSTLLGGLMVALRGVPAKILAFLKSRVVVSLTLDNSPTNPMLSRTYVEFLKWFDTNPWAKYDRNRQLVVDYSAEAKFGPGLGYHWFIYKRRLFWFHVMNLESTGVDFEKERVVLYTLGNNTKIFQALIEEIKPKHRRTHCNVFTVRSCGGGGVGHDHAGTISYNYANTLVLDPKVRANIFPHLDWFKDNAAWYLDKNLDYKKTFLLEGPPGTGKTSIGRAISSYLRRDMFVIDLTVVGNDFQECLNSIPNGSVVIVEDFDNVPTLHRRDHMELGANPDEQKKHVSLSQFINTLQGVVQLNDMVVILSTNHLEKLDPAIYRRGRVDHQIHVNALKEPEIRDYMKLMYGTDEAIKGIVVPPVKASALANYFMINPHSDHDFVDTLIREESQ